MFCLHKHILPMVAAFFKSSSQFHQLVGLYQLLNYLSFFIFRLQIEGKMKTRHKIFFNRLYTFSIFF